MITTLQMTLTTKVLDSQLNVRPVILLEDGLLQLLTMIVNTSQFTAENIKENGIAVLIVILQITIQLLVVLIVTSIVINLKLIMTTEMRMAMYMKVMLATVVTQTEAIKQK
jgi:hypothetical protein